MIQPTNFTRNLFLICFSHHYNGLATNLIVIINLLNSSFFSTISYLRFLNVNSICETAAFIFTCGMNTSNTIVIVTFYIHVFLEETRSAFSKKLIPGIIKKTICIFFLSAFNNYPNSDTFYLMRS